MHFNLLPSLLPQVIQLYLSKIKKSFSKQRDINCRFHCKWTKYLWSLFSIQSTSWVSQTWHLGIFTPGLTIALLQNPPSVVIIPTQETKERLPSSCRCQSEICAGAFKCQARHRRCHHSRSTMSSCTIYTPSLATL